MSECVYCQNTFEMNETCSDEFRMWQGLVGPYYIPSVDENGVLRWTNTGELPNPDAINIRGPAGAGLDIKGTADTVGDLPETAEEFDVYLVGTSEPLYGYIYADGEWKNIGEIGKGEPGDDGVGVPTGGTTGQVLAKASGADYDTEWKTPDPGVDPATANPIMDGTAAVGTSTKYARQDHVHPTDTSRASTSDVTALTEEVDTFVRPNLLDNWYFVGGGSQQGGGQFPINQRGQTSYSNGYGIDRWTYGSAVTINANYVTIQNTTSSNKFFVQRFDSQKLAGKTVCGSAMLSDGTLLTGFGVFPSLGGSNVNLFSNSNFTCRVENQSGGSPGITLVVSANKTVNIAAIKLELGSTQTLAHQENGVWVLNEIPNYQQELAKCQRYFYALTASGLADLGIAFANSTSAALYAVKTPVTMRDVAPVVTASSSSAITLSLTSLSSGINSTGITIGNHTPDIVTIVVSTASNALTLSNAYRIGLKANEKIYISRDL